MRQIRNGVALLGTFAAQIPCQAMDIRYVWTREGWLYLAVILDLHSRRVIGLGHSRDIARNAPPGSGAAIG